MKKINLTNQTINDLTIIKETKRVGTRGYWLCQCKCGKYIEVEGSKIRRGIIQNCGCNNIKRKKAKDRIGEVIGKLTVINITPNKDKNGSVILEWQCDCGNKIYKSYQSIINTHTQSCGCSSTHKITLQPNMRFGKLITIKEMPPVKHNTMWLCKCDCGNEKIILASSLINGKVKSCGCLKSKGELEIKNLLLEHNIPFETEKYFKDMPKEHNKQILRYDFYIDNKYLIEFDGEQHYQNRARTIFWEKNYEQLHKNDLIKNKYALDKKIPLIRIPYWKLNSISIDDLLLETSKYIIN